MNTIQRAAAASLLGLVLTESSVVAALLEANHPRFGVNSLTVDTRTELIWLDLPLSRDLSYLQAQAATLPGGLFEGFRHATADEVGSLFLSAGFAQGFIDASSPTYQDVVSFIPLIGPTHGFGVIGISGTITDIDAVVPYATMGFYDDRSGYFVHTSSSGEGTLAYGLQYHNLGAGNWLVIVPEPSMYALFVTGAALAFLLQKRCTRPCSREKRM